MACTHAQTCPLYENLRSSSDGWRESYCETEKTWKDCARYTWSLKGKKVPLALLPSGKFMGNYNPYATEDEVEAPGRSTVLVAETESLAETEPPETFAKTGFWARLAAMFRGSKS